MYDKEQSDLKNQIRICCLWPFELRFKNNAIYQRILNLANQYQVFLLTKKGVILPDEIKATGVLHYQSPFLSHSDYLDTVIYILFAFLKSISLNRTKKFHVIYTFYDFTSIIGFLLLPFLKARWVVDVLEHPAIFLLNHLQRENLSFSYYVRLYLLKSFVALQRQIFRFADMVIVIGSDVSEGLPRIMSDEYHVNPQRILPVPNGVVLDYTRARCSDNTIHSDRFSIFYVGRVNRFRGVDTLLDAVKILTNRIPNLKLFIIGKTRREEEAWLKECLEKLQLSEYVEHLGALEHEKLLTLMDDSDVCVCPYRNTGQLNMAYPVKMFEYLAKGKPIVATNLSGIAKIIRHGYNGLLVEEGNPEQMAEAIYNIYCDDNLRKSLCANALESVRPYDWANINNKILQEITKLVQFPHESTHIPETPTVGSQRMAN